MTDDPDGSLRKSILVDILARGMQDATRHYTRARHLPEPPQWADLDEARRNLLRAAVVALFTVHRATLDELREALS